MFFRIINDWFKENNSDDKKEEGIKLAVTQSTIKGKVSELITSTIKVFNSHFKSAEGISTHERINGIKDIKPDEVLIVNLGLKGAVIIPYHPQGITVQECLEKFEKYEVENFEFIDFAQKEFNHVGFCQDKNRKPYYPYHIFLVPKGSVAKAWIKEEPKLYGEGIHVVFNPDFSFNLASPFNQKEKTYPNTLFRKEVEYTSSLSAIRHGNLTLTELKGSEAQYKVEGDVVVVPPSP